MTIQQFESKYSRYNAALKEWSKSKKLFKAIPMKYGCSQNVGLAAFVKDVVPVNGHMVAPNASVEWVGLVDVPAKSLLGSYNRIYRHAFVTKACWRHGPTIDAAEASVSWDHWLRPGELVEDTFTGEIEHLHAANLLLKVMLTSAFKFRHDWRCRDERSEGLKHQTYWGNGLHTEKTPWPREWMLRPWVSIKGINATELLQRCLVICEGEGPEYPQGLLRQFLRDVKGNLAIKAPTDGKFLGRVEAPKGESQRGSKIVWLAFRDSQKTNHFVPVSKLANIHRQPGDSVRVGDEIGYAMPRLSRDLFTTSDPRLFLSELGRVFGPDLAQFWLEQWLWSLTDMVNGERIIPFYLVANAATRCVDNCFNLFGWECSQREDKYINERLAAYIFPAIKQDHETQFELPIGEDVRLKCGPPLARLA